LTLHISNQEVRDSFDLYQSQKFDRVLWFAIPATVIICIRDAMAMENPVLLVQHSLILTIYFLYIVLRRKLTSNTNRLYEWAVFATFSVNIIVSSLINARVLPEKITGVNPLTTASTNQFRGAFYTYTAFSVLKVDSYALYFGPLFLIGEFFLQKNDQDFYREFFANVEYSSRYENFS